MIRTPWLVQSLRFENLRTDFDIMRRDFSTGELSLRECGISLNYMGSAEYEFGAFGKSCKRLSESKPCKVLEAKNIQNKNGKNLLYFYPSLDESFTADSIMERILQPLWNDSLRLKESIAFSGWKKGCQNQYYIHQTSYEHAWFDLDNLVFFSFSPVLIRIFYDYITA